VPRPRNTSLRSVRPTLHRLHQVSIQYDCTLTVVPIGTGIYLLCCYMLSTHQSVKPPNCQTVKLSNCQPVNLSNRQSVNLREECPYAMPEHWLAIIRHAGSAVHSLTLPCTGSPAWPHSCASRVSQEISHPMESHIPNSNLETLGYRLLHFLRLSRIIQFSAEISMTAKNTFQPQTSELLPNKSSRIASQDPKRE